MGQIGHLRSRFRDDCDAFWDSRLALHPHLAVDRTRSDLDREVASGAAEVGGRLPEPALPLGICFSLRRLIEGADESVCDGVRGRPCSDGAPGVACGTSHETDPARGTTLEFGDEGRVFALKRAQRGFHLVSAQTRLLNDLIRVHHASRALEYLHDRSEHRKVSAGPGFVHAVINSDATDKAGDLRHAGQVIDGGGIDERNNRPDLAAAIEDLRSLLGSFDEVAPAAMDARFHIHAYNELDLACRTIIEAFDRERQASGDHLRE